MIPITAKMAATQPMVPPTIAPMFLLCFLGDGKFVAVAVVVVVVVVVGGVAQAARETARR